MSRSDRNTERMDEMLLAQSLLFQRKNRIVMIVRGKLTGEGLWKRQTC